MPALAWDLHQKTMALMLDQRSNLVTDSNTELAVNKVQIPTADDQKKIIQAIAVKMKINAARVPVFTAKSTTVTAHDLWISSMVDEPDQGMDQDLPEAWDQDIDPSNDRAWMGGKTGVTSQGFRHMYFAGGIQVPLRAVGKALDRFEQWLTVSDEFAREKNYFWAIRTRLWAIHFLQDLHQPFHVIQIPAFSMLNWSTLFRNFIARSTQSVANHHFAYEALALEWVTDATELSFSHCIEPNSVVLNQTQPISISEVVQDVKSMAKAQNFGSQVVSVFKDYALKSSAVNLPDGMGGVDAYAMTHAVEPDPDLVSLQALTCALYQKMTARTLRLLVLK